MGMVGKKRKRMKKKVMKGKNRTNQGGMGYTLHLQKVVKEKGKKTKANNTCITSLKSYEREETYSTCFPPSFTSRHKRK